MKLAMKRVYEAYVPDDGWGCLWIVYGHVA